MFPTRRNDTLTIQLRLRTVYEGANAVFALHETLEGFAWAPNQSKESTVIDRITGTPVSRDHKTTWTLFIKHPHPVRKCRKVD